MSRLREEIYAYLQEYPPSLKLFQSLEETGDLFLIGGILREYRDYGKLVKLRDIDIIIDIRYMDQWYNILQKYDHVKNKFDGYKIICSNLIVDIWPLNECWAYREKKIICRPDQYVENLPKTVFLNMDSIIYDLSNNLWLDEIYKEAKKSGILDVVLADNPHLELNILRAVILKERYKMEFSDKLVHMIVQKDVEELYAKLIMIQEKRYKEEIVSPKIIKEILLECRNG